MGVSNRKKAERMELEPLVLIRRGPIRVDLYDVEPDYMYADVTIGSRIKRTPFSSVHEPEQLLHDVLEMIGFEATLTRQESDA